MRESGTTIFDSSIVTPSATVPTGRLRGKVCAVHPGKPYCFVRGDDGLDYFCYIASFRDCHRDERFERASSTFGTLHHGVMLTFTPTVTERGRRAEDIAA